MVAITKPEVLLSPASGSRPVGSAAMLTTSVVSARAVPRASRPAHARPRIRDMMAPPFIGFCCARCRRRPDPAGSVRALFEGIKIGDQVGALRPILDACEGHRGPGHDGFRRLEILVERGIVPRQVCVLVADGV